MDGVRGAPQTGFVAPADAGEQGRADDETRKEQTMIDPSSPPTGCGSWSTNLLIATTDAMIGVVLGPLTGRLGGLYLLYLLVLLLASIDVGLGQTVMLSGGPPDWAAFLPRSRRIAHAQSTAPFTGRFDELGALLLGLAWLGAIAATAAAVFQHRAGKAARR